MNDVCVNIVFSTKGTIREKTSIDVIAEEIKKIFGERSKMTSYQQEHNDVEAIFSIQRPLLSIGEADREFMEQLKTLFDKFAQFTPYFTN